MAKRIMNRLFSAIDVICDSRERRVVRHRIRSQELETLKFCFRKMLAEIREDGSLPEDETLQDLRLQWLRLLGAPVELSGDVTEASEKLLGGVSRARRLYGDPAGDALGRLIEAAKAFEAVPSLARERLRNELMKLVRDGTDYRIYCHRKDRILYESLISGEDSEIARRFIHSNAEYANTDSFDTLVVFGSRWTRGWGKAPDALVSSPKYYRCLQFLWGNSEDEDGFGFDPIHLMRERFHDREGDRDRWRKETVWHGDEFPEISDASSVDDGFEFFLKKRANDLTYSVPSVILGLPGEQGIGFPAGAQLWLLDPSGEGDSAIFQMTAEDLSLSIAGKLMLIDLGELGDVDLGGLEVSDERWAPIWKAALETELAMRPERLIHRLIETGISVGYLKYALRRWTRPSSAVVHAPKQAEDFKRLIDALPRGRHGEEDVAFDNEFIKAAWSEIVQSRGAAVQYGAEEHHFIESEKIKILRGRLDEQKKMWSSGTGHQFSIPKEYGIPGTVKFYEIQYIDEAVVMPRSDTKVIMDIRKFDQWRG